MKANLVGHIMTSAVLSIDVHDPVTQVIWLFANYPIHHLPVVEDARVIGMLSTADMLKLEYFMPKSPSLASPTILNERFSIEKMMRPAVTATVSDTITEAAAKMSSHGIHALPVINSTGHLIGIVTTTDIMSALLSGIATGSQPASSTREGKAPSEHRLSRVLEAAHETLQRGKDDDGLAAYALYLHERIELLETLRHDTERYMRGGQDEQLHARLLKDIDHINQQEHAALALRL